MHILLSLALVACGATPNPKAPDEAGLWKLPPAGAAAAPAGAAAAAGTAAAGNGAQKDGSKPEANSAADTAGQAAAGAPARAPAVLPPIPAPAATTVAASDASDLIVASVAGNTIGVRELLAQWVHQNGVEALDQLDHLVLTRLVQEEARRLDVRIDPDKAEQAYTAAVAAIEKKIQDKRPGLTLDQWVDQLLGLDPLVYRSQLRADALNQLLAERVTRAFILESERAEMRVIVVKREDKLKEAQAALAAGESFAEVAKKLSSDPSSKDGGRVPPVIRSETVMGKLAFSTKVGEVGGPQYSQGAWLLVTVEGLPQPLTGQWPEISAAVEASLAQRTIEELEFSQWKSTMLRRYPVDLSPFLKLAGQPVR
jgi:parvulin-like peptidyl-prolyl isomerase